jgi:anti-anti-sigma regulatory factor
MIQESLVFHFDGGDVVTAPRVTGLLTIPDLLTQVRRWCQTGGGGTLVVDLSAVHETEMAVFRALLWGRRHCRARGKDLLVVGPPPGVLPPNVEALLHGLLDFFPDLDSATAAVTEDSTPIPA